MYKLMYLDICLCYYITLPVIFKFNGYSRRKFCHRDQIKWCKLNYTRAIHTILLKYDKPIPNNSMVPGKCGCNPNNVFFKLKPWVNILSTSSEIVLRRIPQSTFDAKLTLVRVMGWCRQATSHYLSPCWSRSTSPYGVRRQWVKLVLAWYIY